MKGNKMLARARVKLHSAYLSRVISSNSSPLAVVHCLTCLIDPTPGLTPPVTRRVFRTGWVLDRRKRIRNDWDMVKIIIWPYLSHFPSVSDDLWLVLKISGLKMATHTRPIAGLTRKPAGVSRPLLFTNDPPRSGIPSLMYPAAISSTTAALCGIKF